jgi:hypothetical protein
LAELLIIFGTQGYIVFYVIGDVAVFPNDLREVAVNFTCAAGSGGSKSSCRL